MAVTSFFDPEYSIFDDENQRENYPTSKKVRLKHRCRGKQKASSSDVTRMEWMYSKGWIEYTKTKGIRCPKLKFTKRFEQEFTLFELQKKRKEVIEKTHLKMITETDFHFRQQIEKEIKEFLKSFVL